MTTLLNTKIGTAQEATFPPPLTALLGELRQDATWQCLVEGPSKGGYYFIDVTLADRHVAIEFRPGVGFGMSDPDAEQGFGEGPQEVYRDPKMAARPVGQWLKRKKAVAAPWLRQCREVLGVSQVELAERLHIGQEAVSKIENRQDVRLSSLVSVIEAMGGRIEVVAHFPECDLPLVLPESLRSTQLSSR